MKQQLLQCIFRISFLCVLLVATSCTSYKEEQEVAKGSALDFMQQIGLERLEPQHIHSDDVVSIAFSPSGNFLVSGSKDNTVKLWDLNSYRVIRSLEGHSSAISQVLYSPSGTLVASVSVDGNIIIWDLTNKGNVLTQFQVQFHDQSQKRTVPQNEGYTIAFHPSENTLASAGKDGSIRIWDVENVQLIDELQTQQEIHVIAYSPDGTYLASGGADNIVRFWDASFNTEMAKQDRKITALQSFRRHYGDVNALAFSANGKYLASASDDCTIIVYSLDDLAQAKSSKEGLQASRVLKGHASNIYAVGFSADSQYIISSSADESINIWNVKNATLERSIKDNHDRIWTVAFNGKSNSIASAGKDVRIKLWSIDGSLVTMLKERLEIATIYDSTMFTVTQLEQEKNIVPQPILMQWREYKLDRVIMYNRDYLVSNIMP